LKEELVELDKQIASATAISAELAKERLRIKNLLGNMDISVDHHLHAPSWACISIQGERHDYIKFISMGERDIRAIQDFLRNFERGKVDCAPYFEPHFRAFDNKRKWS